MTPSVVREDRISALLAGRVIGQFVQPQSVYLDNLAKKCLRTIIDLRIRKAPAGLIRPALKASPMFNRLIYAEHITKIDGSEIGCFEAKKSAKSRV
jgi:hypothetical protein